MGMAAILINGRQPFLQSFISMSQGDSKWNLSNIGLEALVKVIWNSQHFSHTNV